MSIKTRITEVYLPMVKMRCSDLFEKMKEYYHKGLERSKHAYSCTSTKIRLWWGDFQLTTTGRRLRRLTKSPNMLLRIGLITLALVIFYLWASGSTNDHQMGYIVNAENQQLSYVYPRVFNNPERDLFMIGTFPEDFLWGVATSSYQIEGSGDVHGFSGKGDSIWDTFTHRPGNVYNNENGDIACDSYNKWHEDIEMLEYLGVQVYRFSISWPRIMPDGTLSVVNEAGIAYYNRLINALLEAGITPVVTLYHWDLPQALHDKYGGWMDEQIIRDFNSYARLCFERFGDRVKTWITINEPWVITQLGYGSGAHAPGIADDGFTTYIVAHNLIKAHAKVWHTYDDEFRHNQQGRIGITLNSDWVEAADPFVANRMLQFSIGWFAHPIYVNGDYPEVMKTVILEKSRIQGMNDSSRLPEFTSVESEFIRGTSDFFGLNHYTTVYATEMPDDADATPGWEQDVNLDKWYRHNWPGSASPWLKAVPWGMRRMLEWIKMEYNDPKIFITENGYSTSDANELINDQNRMNYIMAYVDEVLKAIELDQVNVIGYCAWSLMDNFEWAAGYSERFGLYYVDFNDEDRPRYKKESAIFYSQLVHNNGFVNSLSVVTSSSIFVLLTAQLAVIMSTCLCR
uniref:Lactase-phlorizin hydrolase-like n=1 Tax=Saccoglossus kowalevskii TaxID=10224 RepID=A0ABM0MC80_SACKO|nr:PREDICTED: lactase-phlorizin hydrolase-like [Saccoglossus kowalevskii]